MKKKWLAVFMAAALTLTACGQDNGDKKAGSTDGSTDASGQDSSEQLTSAITDYQEATSFEVADMDYVCTARASDHEINANLVDGLIENDGQGHLVPSLAEKWEPNEDKSEWTFHLRKGAKWVDNMGEDRGEVKAEDFVTGLRHGAEFQSSTAWLVEGIIKGYSEYEKSDFSDAEWEKVGIEAVDDYTLKYTLEKPVPYFDSMCTYTVLYPVQKDFLESKGSGCKLGSPDKDNCTFGTVALDSILYNGPFILTENTAKSKAVLTKNASYWDADHVYLNTVTRVYDNGEDPYSGIKAFEAGTYQSASLNPRWKDYDEYVKKYEGQTHYTLPKASTFGIVFNFNRQVWNETNYIKGEDDPAKEQTHKAIMNENFRKALRAANDAKAVEAVDKPEDLAISSLRNINNFPEAGTTSDGKGYFQLVTDAYNEATGEKRNLDDGQQPFLSKDEAMKYIEAAKKDGIEFPVHLDLLVTETSDRLSNRAKSMKQSIEENTEGNIIIELVMRDEDTVTNICYLNDDPTQMDYDISTQTGWGPDYADPKSFVDIFSPTTGYYMMATGLDTMTEDESGKEVIANEDLKKELGFMEYEQLYRDADAITDDMDARYKAFAKADAKLIEHCLYIPTAMDARGNSVDKKVPFSRMWSPCGVGQYKYKGLRIADHIITTDEYNKAYEEWLKK